MVGVGDHWAVLERLQPAGLPEVQAGQDRFNSQHAVRGGQSVSTGGRSFIFIRSSVST